MRTFTAAFLAQATSKSAKPYMVLEVDWGGATGTKYYLHRPADSFSTTDGARAPATIEPELVVTWGAIGISLKEGQVGATDQTSVTLDDAAGALTAILDLAEQQRKLVTIWRMFDDPSVVWPGDAGRMFTGCLRPFDWSAQNNQITLNLGDLGPLLAKNVSCIATSAVFAKLPHTSQDKNIPLCWGRAARVEALPISMPWETKLAASSTGGNPETVAITDHPSDMPGVTPGTPYEGIIGAVYDGMTGSNRVTMTFSQSANPESELSTVTLSAPGPALLATVGGGAWAGDPNHYFYARPQQDVQPGTEAWSLDQILAPGMAVSFLQGNVEFPGYQLAAIQLQNAGDNAGIPGSDATWGQPMWRLQVLPNDALLSAQYSGTFRFYGPAASVSPFPVGTILRPVDQTTIYAVSALPSRLVQIVEGFGSTSDSAGEKRKDFVPLGQTATTVVNGSSVTTVLSDVFSINLNDSTWSAAESLGRNITTITFERSPRDMNPNLDDNRIWCTVLGVEDAGDGSGNAILNPTGVILEYLSNSHLMNVDANSIDEESFHDAAAALAAYSVGFPQIETRPGLQLLQEIAAQCNSILLFDQGKAKMVVLSDAAPAAVQATFDTTANDNMLQGSLSTQESSVDDLVNEVIVKWTPFWDDISGNKPNDVRAYKADAIAAFGRVSRELPIYIYWRRTDVEMQRDWWLNRQSSIFRTVKFTAFLDALALQPGDWISVAWIDGGGRNLFGGAKKMTVTKCTDTGKDGLVEIEARYVQTTYS